MKAVYYSLILLCSSLSLTGQSVVEGEYFWNQDPGFGNGIAIFINPSGADINQTFNVTIPPFLDSPQHLFVRVKDNQGRWSSFLHKVFGEIIETKIITGEYYWDTDPGHGNGTPLIVTQAMEDINEAFDIDLPAGLSLGRHDLYVRFQSDSGQWSITKHKTLKIGTTKIIAAEYFFDNDPGFGQGAPLPVTNPMAVISENKDIIIGNLSNGTHVLYVRAKDNLGKWAMVKRDTITVTAPVYVDHTATGNNNGSSWADAYTELKDALDNSNPAIIRVAQGTYFPDLGTNQRDSSFNIRSNTSLLGGFPSGGEIDENRDPEVYPVILSGDIGLPGDSLDNSYHVVSTYGVTNVLVDGFIIEKGNANGGLSLNGGGWLNDGFSMASIVELKQCVFRMNTAQADGAAMANISLIGVSASAHYEACLFENNSSGNNGGAVMNNSAIGGNSVSLFLNCQFLNNQSSNVGGAVTIAGHNGQAQSDFINCSFYNNQSDHGGALLIGGTTEAVITNCSFAANDATIGNNVFFELTASTDIYNSIFTNPNNNASFHFQSGATATITYSLMEDSIVSGLTDNGNNLFNSNPLFVQEEIGDINLMTSSPALNAGNNIYNEQLIDLAGNLRIANSTIDIGAYENQSDSCQLSVQFNGLCVGGNQIFEEDSVEITFQSLNGVGPFNIKIDGVVYDSLYANQTYSLFKEGVDFDGQIPYTKTFWLEAIEDLGGGCINNIDSLSFDIEVIENLTISASDTDGLLCPNQTQTYIVSNTGYSAYAFYDDKNENEIIDLNELLQDSGSNFFSFSSDSVGQVFKVRCQIDLGTCTSTTDVIQSTISANPIASILALENSGKLSNDGQLCNGDSLILIASGGDTYLWNNGAITDSIKQALTNPNPFFVIAKSTSQCVDTAHYTPIVDEPISITTSQVNMISCYRAADGLIEVNATGGQGVFQYNINGTNQSNGLFENLDIGSYQILVQDSNYCSSYESFTLTEPDSFYVEVQIITEQCAQDSMGSIIITPFGGNLPNQYFLNGDSLGPLITGLTSGNFTLIAIDDNLCTDTAMLSIPDLEELTISISEKTNASCSIGSADGFIQFNVIGGVGNYTYDIGGGPQSSNQFSNLLAGNYTLVLFDGNGCRDSLDFEIGSENLSANFNLSTNPFHDTSVVFPRSGSSFDVFSFEINYQDPNNTIPELSYPRLFLDYDGNGIYTDANDQVFILSESNPNDNNVMDGKNYFAQVQGLPVGNNYKMYILALDANGCETTFGPVQGPTVLENPNLYIYANDIIFSNGNPDTSEYFNISTIVHNNSSFDTENFKVYLYNDYLNVIEDSVVVAVLEAGNVSTLNWNVQAVNEDAWVPYKVSLDVEDVIEESNELDNTASKPVIVGDFQLPISIDFTYGPTVSPIEAYAGTDRILAGQAIYTGFNGTLADTTVKGATLSIIIEETGLAYTTNTDNEGRFSLLFPGPINQGTYTISGFVSDQTITKPFNDLEFEVIGFPPACNLPDLYLTYEVSNTIVNSGTQVSGSFTVKNIGCAASLQNSTLTSDFPNANNVPVDFTIPPLAVGQSHTEIFSVIYPNETNTFFSAHADNNFDIIELEESNNYIFQTMQIANDVNLRVPECFEITLSPFDPLSGDQATIEFPIHNTGIVDINDTIAVEIDVNGHYYQEITGGIPAESSKMVSFDINLPNNLNEFSIEIDPNHFIVEKEEDDNFLTRDLCLDLSLETPCLPPGKKPFWEKTHPLNQAVVLEIGLFNKGLIGAKNISVSYEIMGPGFPTWTLIATEEIIQTSNSCGCPVSTIPTLPFSSSTEGVFQIRVTVDENNLHTECDETNNQNIYNIEFRNQPDLRTESAFINPSSLNPDINENINIDISYENIGSANLLDTFLLSVIIDTTLLEEVLVPGLPMDNVNTIAITTSWSSDSIGPHLIQLAVDPLDSIVELLETNNMSTRSIIVGTAPNLYFKNIFASDTAAQIGETILINALIANEGDVSCTANLLFYYLDSNGDSILFEQKPINVLANDELFFNASFQIEQQQTYVIVKIENGDPMEFNLIDNSTILNVNAAKKCNLTVYNTNDQGGGSLRSCMQCANSIVGKSEVIFDIPGAGPHTIYLFSPLPTIIADSVTIKGSSQSGNLPMNGEIIIDGSSIIGNNVSYFNIQAKSSEVYGLKFVHNKQGRNATALFYGTGADAFIIGGENMGNWFVEENWSAAVFLKENINGGLIQGNLFNSIGLQMDKAIAIQPGTNQIQIGGYLSGQKNIFENCQVAAIEFKNGCNNNRFIGNEFIKNSIGIYNFANAFGGTNRGNQYFENSFFCNTIGILHNPQANNNIPRPNIELAKPNIIIGNGMPGNIIEIYGANNNCASITCQGEYLIARDTIDNIGGFRFSFDTLNLMQTNSRISAIQTDLGLNGSSAFSICEVIDTTCVNFVYTCEDDLLGSLRSAIDCASNGDTIYFLNFLNGDSLLVNDSLCINKDLEIHGLGSNLTVLLNTSNANIKIGASTNVVIQEITIKSAAQVLSALLNNYGNLSMSDVRIIDKRMNQTMSAIVNHPNALLNIKELVELFKVE